MSNNAYQWIKTSCYYGYSGLSGPRSRLVKEFMAENAGVHFVDQAVFFSCYSKIQAWLDPSILPKYLTKYGVVKNGDHICALSSTTLMPQARHNSLVKLVEEAGSDGFMFLYMSLRDSSIESIGHQDAAQELDHCGTYVYH